MTPAIWVAIIGAVSAIVAAWLSHRTYRAAERTHEAVNSTMAEMIKLAQKAAHAAGVKEESDRRDKLEK